MLHGFGEITMSHLSNTILLTLIFAPRASEHLTSILQLSSWSSQSTQIPQLETIRLWIPLSLHGKADTFHPDDPSALCCTFKPHIIPLCHSMHFTCIPLLPPFFHPSLSLKAQCTFILFFSLSFTFQAHYSPLHPELKRLNEAPLAESALRAPVIWGEGVVVLSSTVRK